MRPRYRYSISVHEVVDQKAMFGWRAVLIPYPSNRNPCIHDPRSVCTLRIETAGQPNTQMPVFVRYSLDYV